MAGVSTATVSRVINQTAWVEPVTRERVEKAMRDLNYRRNAAAIALAKRSGDMLGLLTGNLADPFFARLATQPTFQRWLLLIVISPVWPTGVSGWKIAAPPGKRPDISWRTGIGASPV